MENESILYNLTNSAADIDKVLKNLISQLNEINSDKILYIKKTMNGETPVLEIGAKGISEFNEIPKVITQAEYDALEDKTGLYLIVKEEEV